MRLIDADELLIAMDTWDKFGYDEQERLIPIGNDDERYVPYVHYADMVKAVNGMPTIDAREEAIDEYNRELKAYIRRLSVHYVSDEDFNYIAEKLKEKKNA